MPEMTADNGQESGSAAMLWRDGTGSDFVAVNLDAKRCRFSVRFTDAERSTPNVLISGGEGGYKMDPEALEFALPGHGFLVLSLG